MTHFKFVMAKRNVNAKQEELDGECYTGIDTTCLYNQLLAGYLGGSPVSTDNYGPLLCVTSDVIRTSVLHGPGLGPRAGPARSPWAGPGRAWIIFCGPGRVRAWNLKARAGPGPVNINFAGRGPGLGLTFPGLGRARAYSESHYYFNIMVKDYLHLSIAKDHCFLCCKCNCTMQCI